ncbi:LysE family translocator [Rhizobium cauense]|uniref:LysE family translocator n=1 Tax=Rhizobium cauense TaxID=1166683 RepID=UPI003B82CAE4
MLPSLELWIPFAIATVAFACVPGPAILYMTAQTLAHGRKAGLMSALGVHIGCYVHIMAAAVGLASLINHAPMAYTAMKFVGASYLVWLGVRMFLGWSNGGDEADRPASASLRDSIIVEVLNPKTVLFFLTFLPQFVDPSAVMPLWAQFLILGIFVNLVFSLADVASVGIASLALVRLKGGYTGSIVPRTCGSILIGLGLTLAGHHV